jgi:hypothetical protein
MLLLNRGDCMDIFEFWLSLPLLSFFYWNFITLYNKDMYMENISKVEHANAMSRDNMKNKAQTLYKTS